MTLSAVSGAKNLEDSEEESHLFFPTPSSPLSLFASALRSHTHARLKSSTLALAVALSLSLSPALPRPRSRSLSKEP